MRAGVFGASDSGTLSGAIRVKTHPARAARPSLPCMDPMKKRACFLIILWAFSATAPLPAQSPSEPDASELALSLDRYFTRATAFGFSGVVLIAEKGQILLHEGYGLADREAGVPLTSGSSLHIGSVGKQFTAAAILRLEADGKLSVDDRLDRFFPDVPDDKREVTVHQLLTHTSGLPYLTTRSFMEVRSREDVMREMLELPIEFEPGSRHAYSNPGYTLLAGVIERVSGESYEEYLAAALFTPAGLVATGFVNDVARWLDSEVRDYSGPSAEGQPLAAIRPLPKAVGAGSIVSTVEDLYRWDRALQREAVLPESSRARLFAPAVPVREGVHYGYGWMIRGTPQGETMIHHAGDLGGYNAEVRRYVERDLVLIVSSNARAGSGYRTIVTASLERLLGGEDLVIPPAVLSAAGGDLSDFTGEYETSSGGLIHVHVQGESLTIGGTGEAVMQALGGASDSAATERGRALSERAANVARALIDQDAEPLREHLHPRASFTSFRQMLLDASASVADSLGAFQGIESLGTAVVSSAGARTYLNLIYEKGVYPLVYRWNGEHITDIDALAAVPMATTFLPTSASGFASHDLFSGRTLEARFDPGPRPSITISGPEGSLTGMRTAKGTSSALPQAGQPQHAMAIDSIASAAVDAGEVVGLSVAVLQGSEWVHVRGYGMADLESLTPATDSTRYYVGSITKSMTAAAVLRLVQHGHLDLDDDVTLYVPELDPSGPPITLRHLLNHTSGLAGPQQVAPRFIERRHLDFSRDELLELLHGESRVSAPGEQFAYNNLGYVVLGIVVERVSAQSYEEHLREGVLGPDDTTSILLCDPHRVIPHRARGYLVREGEVTHHEPVNASLVFSAGGLCSNAADVARWFGSLGRGEILPGALLSEMSAAATLNDGSRIPYGYGLFVGDLEGFTRIHHGGDVNGFSGHAAYYPERDVTVVVLTNTRSPAARRIEQEIARRLLGVS